MFSYKAVIGVGAVLAGCFVAHFNRQDQDAIARRDFMRAKLMFTQNIVEGLATENFDQVVAGAEEIKGVIGGAQWLVHDTPEYQRHSDELKQAVDQLIVAGKSKNLDAAALRYFDMTLRCIDCHKYLRGLRL